VNRVAEKARLVERKKLDGRACLWSLSGQL
jgi:hypothetical protein